MKIKSPKIIELNKHPEYSENDIEDFICEDLSVLGLENYNVVERQKIQQSGRILDVLIEDDDIIYRAIMELQLGKLDEKHFYRTIVYTNNEEEINPQYNYFQVIIAEKITDENIGALKQIKRPTIAFEMKAIQGDDDIQLLFIEKFNSTEFNINEKEIKKMTKEYWEEKSSKKMIELVNYIFEDYGDLVSEYELKYNKYYIGLCNNGASKNFTVFKPRKKFIYIKFKGLEDDEINKTLEKKGINFSYNSDDKEYSIKISNKEEYMKNREIYIQLLKRGKEYLLK